MLLIFNYFLLTKFGGLMQVLRETLTNLTVSYNQLTVQFQKKLRVGEFST